MTTRNESAGAETSVAEIKRWEAYFIANSKFATLSGPVFLTYVIKANRYRVKTKKKGSQDISSVFSKSLDEFFQLC